MFFEYSYEPSSRYKDKIEFKVNDVLVGLLSSSVHAPDQLNWHPEPMNYYVRFQFRKLETWVTVVEELKRYKDENGYKYLTIWDMNNGYAAELDREFIEKVGFRQLPDHHSACYFLE